jgi:hypothetical protein
MNDFVTLLSQVDLRHVDNALLEANLLGFDYKHIFNIYLYIIYMNFRHVLIYSNHHK